MSTIKESCERLAKAMPDYFWHEVGESWALGHRKGGFGTLVWSESSDRELWAFIGPLLEEFNVWDVSNMQVIQGHVVEFDTMLAAAFAAVAEAVEQASK